MNYAMSVKLIGFVALASLVHGCASTSQDTPALVSTNNPSTLLRVESTLRQALGTQSINLGPNATDPTPIISVLPPRLGLNETRSLVTPEMFDVIKRANTCYLVRRTTGVAYALSDVMCTTVAAAN